MIDSTLAKAAKSMQGKLRGDDKAFRGVSTDTRTIAGGELFVALQGPNFDGNAFVDAAARRDAVAAVVSDAVDAPIPTITVEDTRLALGQLAATWRQQMPATVVGITGSNGKTTLKEMIASCLNQVANTLATKGNLNNEIGLPQMLLQLSESHRFAVIEMGANHAGEIAYLSSLAAPSVVVITNAGPAHLEGFGCVEGVAKAKGEILQSSVRPKVAVLNADDEYFDYWSSLVEDSLVVSFGLSRNATVRAEDILTDAAGSTFTLCSPLGRTQIALPLQGTHNVRNACAAAAVGIALDLTEEQIRTGLQGVTPVSGRLRPVAGIRGSRVFDDSYNANPASVAAAAEFLASLAGKSILVLGDMGELGADSAELHHKVGTSAKAAGVNRLMATGPQSQHTVEGFGGNASWYRTVDDVNDALLELLDADSNVLVKGSRSMHMGRVVRAIREAETD